MSIAASPGAFSHPPTDAHRVPAGARLGLALGSFLLLVGIGAADGGYFPTAWGWCVLVFAWVSGVALTVSPRLTFGRLELAFLMSLLLFIAWTALSISWSSDVEQSVLEVQRGMVYLVGALAAVLVVRGGSISHLLGGLLAGITWLSAQALATRLFPGAGRDSAELALGRLAEPIGYFNALGLFAVMGALLALGFVGHGQRLAGRAAAAAALPILLTTAYFTYSRGAGLALAVGLLAAVALDRQRLTLLTTGILLALPSAAAVWLASRAPALSSLSAERAAIAAEGNQLTIRLLALSAASAVIALVVWAVERRVRVPRRARRAYGALLGSVGVALIVVAVASHGGPGTLARQAYDGLNTNPPSAAGDRNDLNSRLGRIGSPARIAQYRVARRQHEQHPWIGSGAGTFEQFWLRYRPNNVRVRDTHSLYLETLAELGWPGIVLVVIMLALPLAGAVRARRRPLVMGAFGAYIAYVFHAGIDWDWEMPVLTLLVLFCAVALFVAGHEHAQTPWALPVGWRAAAVAAVIAAAVFSSIGLIGNRALSKAADAVDRAAFRIGEAEARTAVRWAPWSAEAHQQLGRAQAALGRERQGRATLRKALRMSPDDWRIWYDLGIASSGRQRQRAFARAAKLNPLEDDIQVLREQGYLPAARIGR